MTISFRSWFGYLFKKGLCVDVGKRVQTIYGVYYALNKCSYGGNEEFWSGLAANGEPTGCLP